jgi:hypothetical protein
VPEGATLADERAIGPRPYLNLLAPETVIACYEDKATGEITFLKWWDKQTEWDEARGQEVEVERVHERWPGRFKTWVNKDSAWTVEKEGNLTLPGGKPAPVMFHVLYAEKEGHMVATTPLTEVADLTIEHWQLASDYRTCLNHALFPILYATGVDQKQLKNGNTIIGPRSILGSDKAEARFGYVEHTGAAIEAGKSELEALEQRAETYAGRLTKPSGDVKATTEAISSSETSSFAKDMALSMQDVLQAALDHAALWTGTPMGKVKVSTDFAVDLGDSDLTTLQAARAQGDVSRPTYWKELQRRNVLSRDFDPKDEATLIEDENAEGMEREQEAMKFAASLEAPRQPGGAGGPPAA